MSRRISLKKYLEENIREIVFGLEDSLVSTLGAITGIAAGTGNAYVVILSGVVLIFVESLSMSAGSYLSSKSAAEASRYRKKDSTGVAVRAGFVMGVFYLFGGAFPLLPYFLLPVGQATAPSIVITAVALFLLGIGKAKVVGTKWLRSGLEMTLVSLSAAALGFLVGRVVAVIFGLSI